ncbi:uncharacterized protein BDZ99DRAFT_525050 [Mytilinidion resinicola]|uniref:Integral membrane protein n=1 Tax=Mytilinidion resinicola TaxID=574789 RepID=A0A6A6YB61_9PEZI|nr:uncharacterized protein BDZ99DRAFT_525050 [Mytilinidion resinicola]KAF2805345.1 hypothetical protein BDZ99DRAFT_525050 [Mytilinidion resinicola]
MAMDHSNLMAEMDKLASIKMMTFQVTVGVFFALSVILVIARAATRLRSRRAMTLDDYLVFWGCLCLIAATALTYANFDNMYLTQALFKDPTIITRVKSDELLRVTKIVNTLQMADLELLWAATFAVKFSFLAFFRQLIQSVDKIHRYY